jgi:hypothetical protein
VTRSLFGVASSLDHTSIADQTLESCELGNTCT